MTTDGGSGRRKYSPSFFVCLAITLFFLGLAITDLRSTAHFGSLLALADDMDAVDAYPPAIIEVYAQQADRIAADGECRTDAVTAAGRVVLANMELQDETERYDQWVDVFTRAERYFTHAIACSPQNGDAWLRLAMIRQAIAEQPAEIAALMSRSVWAAPAEQDVVAGRLGLWSRVSPATLAAADAYVKGDIEIALLNGDPAKFAPVLEAAGPHLMPYVIEAAKTLPDDRRLRYYWAGLDFKRLKS